MVVAIRGTQSIADLVTDAVVHPEPMDSWVPQVFYPLTPSPRAPGMWAPHITLCRLPATFTNTFWVGSRTPEPPFVLPFSGSEVAAPTPPTPAPTPTPSLSQALKLCPPALPLYPVHLYSEEGK